MRKGCCNLGPRLGRTPVVEEEAGWGHYKARQLGSLESYASRIEARILEDVCTIVRHYSHSVSESYTGRDISSDVCRYGNGYDSPVSIS